jgi:MYXO-CTERM domain-containing protein
MSVGPEHYASRKVLLPVLAAFALWRLRRRASPEFGATLFCVGWFLLWLAPVLVLPNHISEYYLVTPLAGLAWLGGWAIISAWRAGWLGRAAVAGCLTLYLANALPAIRNGTGWYLEGTSRMRLAFRGMQEVAFQHPGAMMILRGVDDDLFKMGFEENPFRLAGASQGFLAPGTEKDISVVREDLGGISSLTISRKDALRAIDSGQARELEIERHGPPRDITRAYESVLRSDLQASRAGVVAATR